MYIDEGRAKSVMWEGPVRWPRYGGLRNAECGGAGLGAVGRSEKHNARKRGVVFARSGRVSADSGIILTETGEMAEWLKAAVC